MLSKNINSIEIAYHHNRAISIDVKWMNHGSLQTITYLWMDNLFIWIVQSLTYHPMVLNLVPYPNPKGSG